MDDYKAPGGERFFIALVILTILLRIGTYQVVNANQSTWIAALTARTDLQKLLNASANYPQRLAMVRNELKGPTFAAVRADVERFVILHGRWSARADKDDMAAMRATVVAADRLLAAIAQSRERDFRREISFSLGLIVLLTIILGTLALWSDRRRTAEARALHEELAARNRALEQSNQSLEAFAYIASHDLQEPLRTVANFTQLLQHRYAGRLDAQADEYIAFATEAATRMQELIDDVLEYSRVSMRGNPLEPLDLDEPLTRSIHNLATRIRETGADIERGPMPMVTGDAGQMTQLFQNLIANGLKYNGASRKRVSISASTLGNEAVIRVEDNGIGIALENHERVFGLFTRLHTRTEYSGTGIGLAIARRIVERHGGRSWVESVEGGGAAFVFTVSRSEA